MRLATHDIEVSTDGETWTNIHDENNDMTEKTFWSFKGTDGAPGAWYDEKTFNDNINPLTSVWVKNIKGEPVFLRITLKSASELCQIKVPEKLMLLAGKWMQKSMEAVSGTAYASAYGDAPPDPPSVSGATSESIGAASPDKASGGGSCFIKTLGRDDQGAGPVQACLALRFFCSVLFARRLKSSRNRT